MDDQNQDSTSATPVTSLPSGAEGTEPKGAENKEGQGGGGNQPPVRTYSEADWNKRQSNFDKQMSKTQERIQELERIQTEAAARAQQDQYSGWLEAIEDSGGDVDAAGKAISALKATWQKAQDILAREAHVTQHAALLEEATKKSEAARLVKEHSLPDSAVEDLLDSKDPTEMELKAFRLGAAQKKTEGTPKTKVDSGGDAGARRNIGDMHPHEAMGQLMAESLEQLSNK